MLLQTSFSRVSSNKFNQYTLCLFYLNLIKNILKGTCSWFWFGILELDYLQSNIHSLHWFNCNEIFLWFIQFNSLGVSYFLTFKIWKKIITSSRFNEIEPFFLNKQSNSKIIDLILLSHLTII